MLHHSENKESYQKATESLRNEKIKDTILSHLFFQCRNNKYQQYKFPDFAIYNYKVNMVYLLLVWQTTHLLYVHHQTLVSLLTLFQHTTFFAAPLYKEDFQETLTNLP